MKGFVIGLLIGAATSALVQRYALAERQSAPAGAPAHFEPNGSAQSPSVSSAPASATRAVSHPGTPIADAQAAQSRSPGSQRPTQGSTDEGRIAKFIATNSVDFAYLAADEKKAFAEMDLKCVDHHIAKQTRIEERIKAEPKDPQWAYPMEQLIEQFIAAHPNGHAFELAKVDCRTRYCEITAKTIDASGSNAVQTVMNDLQQQPWSEFGAGSDSGSTSSGDGATETYYRHWRGPPLELQQPIR